MALECHADHTTETFIGVFKRHADRFPKTEPLHYVMDNLSSHRGYPFCRLVADLSGLRCPSEQELSSQAYRHSLHPFRWAYDGEGLHEKAVKRFTAMLLRPAGQMELRPLTKLLMLMTNLLKDYFSKVSEESWRQLAASLSSQSESIATLHPPRTRTPPNEKS